MRVSQFCIALQTCWHRIMNGTLERFVLLRMAKVLSFSTEQGYDRLTVNGIQYDGSAGPHGIISHGTIHWSADARHELSRISVVSSPFVISPQVARFSFIRG